MELYEISLNFNELRVINSLEKRRVYVAPPRPAAPPSPRLQCSTSASSSLYMNCKKPV